MYTSPYNTLTPNVLCSYHLNRETISITWINSIKYLTKKKNKSSFLEMHTQKTFNSFTLLDIMKVTEESQFSLVCYSIWIFLDQIFFYSHFIFNLLFPRPRRGGEGLPNQSKTSTKCTGLDCISQLMCRNGQSGSKVKPQL